MRRRPPEIIRKTKTARAKLKIRGREGWIFFNPTKGTYQSRKMKKKRIKQVRTKRPIKILFLGLSSNGVPNQFGVICSQFGALTKESIIDRTYLPASLTHHRSP
jgi:hypothetical protein